ncbi:sensor domain-containing diguanylate cyclase [Caldimonas brevitalea]|uniref:diguanylate cyclase n=1 Tax=Caldimonas brevitalea TaxID=413882 RepID=A0A0G3BLK4_9BURK|nr:sensor domain-containing diguanylate cyclase [Caldimonas brevitalea]AKJ30262.1 diguanylate cyclase/phosphodiesterase [Caldimonas brevitalea]
MLRSFRLQITLVFGLICAAVAVSLSVVLTQVIGAQVARNQGQALGLLARSTSSILSEGLYERMREIELLAANPDVAGAGLDPALWRPLLERMQRTRPHFAWIGVTDAKGVVHASTGGLLQGQDVSARPWFQHARSAPYAGDVHPAKLLEKLLPRPDDGEPMRFIDFAAPLHDPQGRLLGVLGAHGSWAWAGEITSTLLSQAGRAQGIGVFIVDAKGVVIHHPEGEGRPEERLPPAMLAGGEVGELQWPDGQRYLTARATVPAKHPTTDLGWTVVVRQPVAQAFETARSARDLVLGAGGLAALGAMACAWVVAGHFSRPLQRISASARRIEAGDLDVQLPADATSAELQQLGASLQAMTRTLVEQRREVERTNEDLEMRVAQRTAALERATAELESLARRDPLTGLFNRRAADDRLEHELALHRRHGRPLAVLLGDVDHFKRVNDTHGHEVGDRVLIEVAQRLSAHCRGTDFIARVGGEEFLLLLPETDTLGAVQAAEKLRRAVCAEPIAPVGTVTLSIGVAQPQGPEPSPKAMLRAADQALYEAKRQGRDRVVVAAGHHTAAAGPDLLG